MPLGPEVVGGWLVECGFNLTAPGLPSAGTLARSAPSLTAVRCPRISVHHRNKAACGLVVLPATPPPARRT